MDPRTPIPNWRRPCGFKSSPTNGFQAFAVAGVNTVSFGITASEAARPGLLGFAVERALKGQRFEFRPGFKVFRSLVPHPTKATRVSTKDHPVQSFVWDDFTARPDSEYEYRFHPLRGTPDRLDRTADPIRIRIRTEPLFSDKEHDVFFNRGVASSQAYAERFKNKSPDKLSPKKRAEALQWLSRELDDAILKFIASAERGDTLLCCFYEFRYDPVVQALKDAVERRGVNVQVIIDAKLNGRTTKDKKTGKTVTIPAFPREDNLATIERVGFPTADERVKLPGRPQERHPPQQVHGPPERAHQTPTEVWTGSTNISAGGIFGQTNVGHWVRNRDVAKAFRAYWDLLHTDPGGAARDDRATVRRKNKEFQQAVERLQNVPAAIEAVPGVERGLQPPDRHEGPRDVLRDGVFGQGGRLHHPGVRRGRRAQGPAAGQHRGQRDRVHAPGEGGPAAGEVPRNRRPRQSPRCRSCGSRRPTTSTRPSGRSSGTRSTSGHGKPTLRSWTSTSTLPTSTRSSC